MKILFQTYWGINDGLTTSTVFPNLKILAGFSEVDKIILSTIEREGEKVEYTGPKNSKIEFNPRYSLNIRLNQLNKIFDFLIFAFQLYKICKNEKIDYIIGRGALAGSLSLIVGKLTNTPVVVESFEPHTQYMVEAGVWPKKGIRRLFGSFLEKKIIQKASYVITVSQNFKDLLIGKGVAENKLKVVPCCVDLERFKRNDKERQLIRENLKIEGNFYVGIYVGKFGGIYYDKEAYEIFKTTSDIFGQKFFLIILTPDNSEKVKKNLMKAGLAKDSFFVERVPHHEVPKYLSAADFAFALQTYKPSNLFLSPIKNGEYWASGLPLLTTEGVGDDDQIIKKEKTGFAFNLDNKGSLQKNLMELKFLLEQESNENLNKRIYNVADKYRNFAIAQKVYEEIFL